MKIPTLITVAGLVAVASFARAGAPAPAGPEATWTAPPSYIAGLPYVVSATYTWDSDEAGTLPDWWLGAGAFSIGGEPLGERGEGTFGVEPGTELTVRFDLGAQLEAAGVGATFQLAGPVGEPVEVTSFVRAPEGLDFINGVPEGDLANYMTLLKTNRGDMLLSYWPHLAPNHVRNHLDLAYTGFYDGVLFHRVIPGFMIQGGDPTGTGGGNGPRLLQAEFSAEPHVRGVLSMARTQDPNSGSCQFFVMHAAAPHLDGQYSVFGKLVDGYDTLDAIVNAPQGPQNRPVEEQKILSATVLMRAAQ